MTDNEYIKAQRLLIRDRVPEIVAGLVDIFMDPEQRAADRIAAGRTVINKVLPDFKEAPLHNDGEPVERPVLNITLSK